MVAEIARIEPPAAASDGVLARFWNDVDCRRWAEALEVESESGLAICDTDPLKLHYGYCLARIGVASWDRFEAGVAAATDSVGSCRLGIADLVLVSIPDERDRYDRDLFRAWMARLPRHVATA